MRVRAYIPTACGARAIAILCTAVVVATTRPAHAGINVWTSHSPPGWDVLTLAIDPKTPSTLYAGTDGGVFKSTDAGTTWGNTGLGAGVSALALDPLTPTTLYAGKASSIFARSNFAKSTDGGATWNLTLLPGGSVVALAIDPMTPSTLYATAGGVLKSTDGGDNWDAINTGLPDVVTFTALVIDPTTPSTLYIGTSDGNYKSMDAGGTWEVSGLTNVDVFALAIDPSTPNTLYAGTNGSNPGGSRNVYKSTDAGATWEATSPISPSADSVVALAIDPSMPDTLYAGTNGNGVVCVASPEASCGVFKTTDSGGTWSPVRTGLPLTFVNALAIDSTTIPPSLYAGTAAGVFSIQEVTSVVGVGSAASCTDAALNTALTRGGLVTFNCGGPATIDISSGTGTKIIAADTMVDGGGLITLSGGNAVGVFRVNADINFTVKNLTIANGHVSDDGAGIANDSGLLTVINSTFTGNSAGRGGGIYNDSGTLRVTSSTFRGNSAGTDGGAIANRGALTTGAPTVTSSTFSGNSAARVGGGVYDATSTLTVTGSTFSGNSAGLNGGGIAIATDDIALFKGVIVANTTFFGNTTAGRGGGIYYAHNANGLSVFSSTFTGNRAATGAAVYNDGNDGLGGKFPDTHVLSDSY